MTKHPEQIPKVNLNQSGFTKCETTFFCLRQSNTPKTCQTTTYMPNRIFSCEITL